MPITLPAGVVPEWRTLSDDEVLVAGQRSVSWRWEVLDADEVMIGTLDGVVPGGSVDWTANASIKGGGRIMITDTGQDVDWLNVRLRPICTIDGFSREIPVGVWLPVAPDASISDLGRSWDVMLLDKLTILDADVWLDPTSGEAATYVAAAGEDVVSLVVDLIVQAGESTPAIESGTGPTVAREMVWEAGTTRLKIINDLLDAAGYFSLWTDNAGQFRVAPYTRPLDRAAVYVAIAPFEVGPTSIMDPSMSHKKDIFSVPNRYVCIGQGDMDTEALTSVATNVDSASPYSYPARHNRWVTRVETGVEAVDQAALDLITQRKLDQETAVTSRVDLTHPYLPDLTFNSVISARHPEAGIDALFTVTKTSVIFDFRALCSTSLQEVAHA